MSTEPTPVERLIEAATPREPRALGGLLARLGATGSMRGARVADMPADPGALAQIAVTGVAEDSREVGQGTLFVAVPGFHVDGHDYLARAAAAVGIGAKALWLSYGLVTVLCAAIFGGAAISDRSKSDVTHIPVSTPVKLRPSSNVRSSAWQSRSSSWTPRGRRLPRPRRGGMAIRRGTWGSWGSPAPTARRPRRSWRWLRSRRPG